MVNLLCLLGKKSVVGCIYVVRIFICFVQMFQLCYIIFDGFRVVLIILLIIIKLNLSYIRDGYCWCGY